MTLKAPFPWFGGKSRVADVVWARFGDVPSYVEPFAGTASVLLARPDDHVARIETINDFDGFVANFWRATSMDPDAVAKWADWPVNENDLHARHWWLKQRKDSLRAKLEGDPLWFDAQVAGWWVWGICAWIGSGWCGCNGPWTVVDGEMIDSRKTIADGVWRQLPHLGSEGMGINRKRPHLGNEGMGINRQLPHLGNEGRGSCDEWSAHLRDTFGALRDRLRRVRVCCGDWSRVCGETPTVKVAHPCGVFLDPPYAAEANRCDNLYAEDSISVAHKVREWAIAHGDDPRYKIALCGYDGEHEMPQTWAVHAWSTKGGYGSQRAGYTNRHKERIWFSPHCLRPDEVAATADVGLFAQVCA